jgi:hypothetical protein
MREYQISTPRFPCWVQVNADGVVVGTAPYLRTLILGKRWQPTVWALLRLHEARVTQFSGGHL